MPLFIDEAVDKKLSKKTTVIPKNIRNLAIKVKGEYGNDKTRDGYKTVNRLLDSSYNKGKIKDSGVSKKEDDNLPKVDGNDGLTKFPTSAARKMVISLKNNKGFIDQQAKDTIVNYLQSDVKSKESAVKDNNNVPKVPKLAKPAKVQNTVKPPKQTIVNGSAVEMHESFKNKKKIRLAENQLILLKEYHGQLNIPFNHDTPNYDYKETWEDLVDFFEDIGRYGTLSRSRYKNMKQVYDEYYEENIKKCYDNFLTFQDDNGEAMYGILYYFFSKYHGMKFLRNGIQGKILDYVNQPNYQSSHWGETLYVYGSDNKTITFDTLYNDILLEYVDEYDYTYDDIKKLFTPEAEKLLNQSTFEYYTSSLEDNNGKNFMLDMTMNNRGLIYVERTLSIPRIHGRKQDFLTEPYYRRADKNNPDRDKRGSYYELLKSNYDAAGKFWTWEEGNGQAYNEQSYDGGNDYVDLCGWVNPDDIDWETTIYRNGYEMKEEKEVYIDSAYVEVDKIIFSRYSKHYNLIQKPMLLPTTEMH